MFVSNCIKIALEKYSGQDPVALLCAYFSTPTGKKSVHQVIPGLCEAPLLKVLKNIKKQHDKAPSLHKRQWLSLVANIFTREWLQSIGFQFSTNAFTSAKKYADTYGAGTPWSEVPKILPPSKQPISEEIIQQVSMCIIFIYIIIGT